VALLGRRWSSACSLPEPPSPVSTARAQKAESGDQPIHRYGANPTDPQDAWRVIASIAAEFDKIDIFEHVMGGFAAMMLAQQK